MRPSRRARVIPIYEFQCQHCGLRFEAVGDADKSEEPKTCQCGEKAERLVPEDINYHFDTETEGIGPQNTGVSDVDYEVDRIIAKDAEEKWAAVEDREGHKRTVLRDHPDASKEDLAREPDGTYAVMDKKVKEGADRVRTINNVAMQLIKRKRKRLSPSG